MTALVELSVAVNHRLRRMEVHTAGCAHLALGSLETIYTRSHDSRQDLITDYQREMDYDSTIEEVTARLHFAACAKGVPQSA